MDIVLLSHAVPWWNDIVNGLRLSVTLCECNFSEIVQQDVFIFGRIVSHNMELSLPFCAVWDMATCSYLLDILPFNKIWNISSIN
jgi:hypothetical protein